MTQNAVELEKEVLGQVIYNQNEIYTVLDVLKREHFYDDKYGIVWDTILNLHKNKTDIDLLTVTTELKRTNYLEYLGGVYWVSQLTTGISHIHNTEYNARIIIEKYMLRQIFIFAESLKARSMEPNADCFELSEKFSGFLSDLSTGFSGNKIVPISKHRDEILEDCTLTLVQGKINGVPIRLNRLNDWINGWRKGNLIVIAARPGMGKTASGIDFAEYPASLGIPVAFFSLEMPAKELTGRIMSIYSGVSAQRINNNIIEDIQQIEHIRVETSEFEKLPLYIDDSPYLTLYQLRIKALRLKREKGIELIIVDYLQLMEGSGNEGNREQELSKISRGLKGLAKELDLPIIALAQLNRESTKRTDQKPKASDIRECGAIEQDADMIIFPHRPEYLKLDSYMINGQEVSSRDLIVYIIEKFRGGAIGEIPAHWDGRLMKISDNNSF